MAFGIDDAIAAGLKIVDKFIPDPEARAKAESELRSSLLAWDQGQLAVNRAEAAHVSIFVAGWRPWIGWVCGAALTWQFVLAPLVTWGAAIGGVTFPAPPMLDDQLWELMFAMLGMGGLRTFEKLKGVDRSNLKK